MFALLSLLLSQPAAAYTFSGGDWSWMGRPLAHHVYLDLDSFPDSMGQPDEIEDSVIAGIEAWNGHANLELVYGGDPQFALFEPEIVITYVDDGGGPLAQNIQSYGVLGADHCDIEVFGRDSFFVFPWVFEDGDYGVQMSTNITHEVGHCLGLGHGDWGAVMYESQTNSYHQLLPTSDDLAGLRVLYDSAYWGLCNADADGDGYRDCDGDCNDQNSDVGPAEAEICDGIDNDCDMAVDEQGTLSFDFGSDTLVDERWGTVAFNAYTVTETTTLETFEATADVVEDGLVTWLVYEVDSSGQATLLASPAENHHARNGTWVSPLLNIEMVPEATYYIGLGARGYVDFDREPLRDHGYDLAQVLGFDSISWNSPREFPDLAPRTEYAYQQTLNLTPASDTNGDGTADVCGSPCDDVNDDDGDGTRNCDDACPNEPDTDGICVDNCPTIDNVDQADADGDGVGDACDATPNGTGNTGGDSGNTGNEPDPVEEPTEAGGDAGCSAFQLAPASGLLLGTMGLFSRRRLVG